MWSSRAFWATSRTARASTWAAGGRCLSNEFSTICHLLLNHWLVDRLFRRRVVANRVKCNRQEPQVPTVHRTRPFTVRARADMGTTGRTVRAPARATVATAE